MKVIELVSENFKRLNVKVKMDGKSVTVEGKNGVGKSSFIDAIWIALTGKDIPETPIQTQTGKEFARISVTVKSDDGTDFIVERCFNQKSTNLTVKTLSGAKYSSPQKFLDEKIGKISFDPFDFVNKQPREQKNFLMDLLKLNFDDIDSLKRELLTEKESINQENKTLNKKISEIEHIEEPLELKDTLDIIKKYQNINTEREKIKQNQNLYVSLLERSEIIRKQKLELREKLAALEILHEQIDKKIVEFGDNPNFDLPELNNVESEIKEIEQHNEKVKQQKKRLEIKDLISKNDITENEIKNRLSEVEKIRIDRIKQSKMPIDNLSFSDEGVLFDGLPFTEEQLSHAKIIEIGIKIQMALNPSLRIMRVKDGSLLDSDTLKTIKKLASDNDYQLFIEKVSDSKEIGFIIEEN